jgi:hypothetical protein
VRSAARFFPQKPDTAGSGLARGAPPRDER